MLEKLSLATLIDPEQRIPSVRPLSQTELARLRHEAGCDGTA